jgi:hypothetical protein
MMAKFKSPDELDFSQPSGWPSWKERFERFAKATKLNKEDGDVQVSTLIYTMGPQAETLFKTFSLSADDSKKIDKSFG